MPNIGGTVRIRGTPQMLTKLGNIRSAPQKAMREAASNRIAQTIVRYQSEMASEYHSAWARGEIAKSIKGKIKNEADGVSVQFTARGGARDHIQFITGILPDSYFQTFPVRPFEITPGNSRYLRIRFPGQTRAFIQNKVTGRMEGSENPSAIFKKKVLWGSRSGGFSRDVIAEVSQSEGEVFVAEMMAAVAAALSQSSQ